MQINRLCWSDTKASIKKNEKDKGISDQLKSLFDKSSLRVTNDIFIARYMI